MTATFTYPMSATFADAIIRATEDMHGDHYEYEVWEAKTPTDGRDYWSDEFTHRRGLESWEFVAQGGYIATGLMVDIVTRWLILEMLDMFEEGPDYVRLEIDGDDVVFRAGFWTPHPDA